MSHSNRHHYLPVFYSKGFTNPDGFFYVYDVVKGEFKNHGRKFAPSTQFYEHFGNTINSLGGKPNNYIEDQYTKMDSKISRIIRKIKDGGKNDLTEYEWQMIQYFVNVIYWRIPANTDKVKHYIAEASSLKSFRMHLNSQKTGELASEEEQLELLQKIKQDTDFYKYIKLGLPAITFPEIFEKNFNNSATIFCFDFKLPTLLGDNPIIYRNPYSVSRHHDDFVFPITPKEILFRHRLKIPRVYSPVRVMIDMLQVMQAKEYVVCSDLEYPIKLQDTFSTMYGSIEKLRKAIFESIIEDPC